MSKMDYKFFNLKNTRNLDYNELDGKVLKMIIVNNVDGLLVAGQDVENKIVYILDVKENRED